MKYKTIVLMLALTVAAWAQTATSNPPASTTPEKTKCACCDKSATTDGQSCARQMAKSTDGKQAASCCDNGSKSCCAMNAKCMKNSKSCCSGADKGKTAASCCGSECAKSCGKGCCSGKTQKAGSCCHKALQG